MEEDDEMILLVVGDDISVEDIQNQMPAPIFVKHEPLGELEKPTQANEIMRTVTENGIFLDVEVVKEEYIEIPENTFDDITEPTQASKDVENITDFDTGREVEGMDLNKHGVCQNLQNPNKKKKRRKNDSFIKSLKATNPEVKKNPSLIVDHLLDMMRNVKLPELPLVYYIIVADAHNNLKYKCTTCNTVSKSSSSAGRHYQEKHGLRYLICYACGDDFRSTTNLYKHEKRCKSRDARLVLKARGRFLGRRGRGRPFLTEDKFVVNKCEATTMYYCATCGASFRRLTGLTAHENLHVGRRPHRCYACPAAYTSDQGLKRHLLSHSNDKFICDHCGREFNMKHLLRSHLRKHQSGRAFNCPTCPRMFTSSLELENHRSRAHLDVPDACPCPACPKRYARMCDVEEHMNKEHELTLITKGMLSKLLPKMSDTNLCMNAKIVSNSDVAILKSQLPNKINKEVYNEKPQKVYKEPQKMNKEECQKVYKEESQKVCRIIENFKDNKSEEDDYEITADKENNVLLMDDFLQYIQNSEDIGKEQAVYEMTLDNDKNVIMVDEFLI